MGWHHNRQYCEHKWDGRFESRVAADQRTLRCPALSLSLSLSLAGGKCGLTYMFEEGTAPPKA